MTSASRFLEAYGGGILLGAFLLLMARILYWLVVVVPRQTREIYTRLEASGYAPRALDDTSVAGVLTRLAPVFPKDPPADVDVPAWQVRHAAVRDQWGHQRVVVNAHRWQVERTGVRTSNLRCSATILVEPGALPLEADLHLVPAGNRGRFHWEERHGLPPASLGLAPELAALYEAHAAPGTGAALPEPLARVLAEACPLLVDRSRFCFQHGVSLRFGPEGWGITTSNEVHEQVDMDHLLDLADRVAGALRT